MEFRHIRELGWWNVFILTKAVLYLTGRMDFLIGLNIALVLFLLLEADSPTAGKIKNSVAILLSIVLVITELGFPIFSLPSLVTDGNFDAIIQPIFSAILYREFLLAPVLLATAYYYFSRTIEFGIVSCIAVTGAALLHSGIIDVLLHSQPSSKGVEQAVAEAIDSHPDDTELNTLLSTFFTSESARSIEFADDSPGFDIVILSVCSLAWDDLDLTGLRTHPLFDEFDIVFDNFNSATSYSGPALIRLLRANCGQQDHPALFKAPSSVCLMASRLDKLGYQQSLVMNHDGVFDNFLGLMREFGGLKAPLLDQSNLEVAQKAFDGSPVYDDGSALNSWLINKGESGPRMLLYNTVSLHDGNRLIEGKSGAGVAGYKVRAEIMLDDLHAFIMTLEKRSKPTLVLFVPEHGAGMKGDRLQLSGMREIPSPSITHVPVAAKLIGATRRGPVYRVPDATSHLAITALINNVIQSQPFKAEHYSAQSLGEDLPRSRAVSQNEGSTVIETEGSHYLTLDRQRWQPYPAD